MEGCGVAATPSSNQLDYYAKLNPESSRETGEGAVYYVLGV